MKVITQKVFSSKNRLVMFSKPSKKPEVAKKGCSVAVLIFLVKNTTTGQSGDTTYLGKLRKKYSRVDTHTMECFIQGWHKKTTPYVHRHNVRSI